jgi:protein-tyrosine kinase
MGKVFDALERYKQNKSRGPDGLRAIGPENRAKEVLQTPIDHASVIQNGCDPKVVVLSAPESVDAEHFKLLRAQVFHPKDGKKPRAIMITSAFPGEGKTFVAVNLAASIAMGINEHVLLVDCDFRRPNLHNMLGYSNTQGLREYLTGEKRLPQLLIRTRIEKLSLLTAGSPCTNPSELLSSAMMREFLEEVKGRYQDRYVIVDATPSHVTAEVGVLSKLVDGIIYVIMAGKAPRETIRRNLEDLGKEKVLGIVFNGHAQSYRAYHKYYEGYYR